MEGLIACPVVLVVSGPGWPCLVSALSLMFYLDLWLQLNC